MAEIVQNHKELNLFTYLWLEQNRRAFSNPNPEIPWHILQEDDRFSFALLFFYWTYPLSNLPFPPSLPHKQISSDSVPAGHWVPKHCPMLFKKQEWFSWEMLHSLVLKVTFTTLLLFHHASCSQGYSAPGQSFQGPLLAWRRMGGVSEN